MSRKFTDEQIIEIYNTEYVINKLSMPKIANKYNVGLGCIWANFKRLGLQARSDREKSLKYSCDNDYFDVIDTQDKAYWLGFISADGYITSARKQNTKRVGISLHERDAAHLDKFKACIKGNMPVKHYVEKRGYASGIKYCRIMISGNKMADDLIRHGVLEHKSNTIKRVFVAQNLTRHFIRGYFDGDGSIWCQSNNGTNVQYSVGFIGTRDMMMYIQEELMISGVIDRFYDLTKRHESDIAVNFKFGGNEKIIKLKHYFYDDAITYMDRKYQKFQDLEEMLNSRA